MMGSAWRNQPVGYDVLLWLLDFESGHSHCRPAALLASGHFHLADILEFLDDAVENCHSPVEVRHLATAKQHGELDLATLLKELPSPFHLEIAIMRVNLGPEAHLFQYDQMLFLLSFVIFFLLVVLHLAEIHNSANRWRTVWRNLYQVETNVACQVQGLNRGHDTDLLIVLVDHAYLWDADLFVRP